MKIPSPEHTPSQSFGEFPDELWGLEESLDPGKLARPSLFVRGKRDRGLSTCSYPDMPADAPEGWPFPGSGLLGPMSCLFQVNLAELPQGSRPDGIPSQGMVWVFADFDRDGRGDRGWTGEALFDPRDPSSLEWKPVFPEQPSAGGKRRKPHADPPRADTVHTLPCSSESTTPDLAGWDRAMEAFDEWACKNSAFPSDRQLQVGGWHWPCQGDFEGRNRTFVAGIFRQAFGDHGEACLHFDREKGFFVTLDTH